MDRVAQKQTILLKGSENMSLELTPINVADIEVIPGTVVFSQASTILDNAKQLNEELSKVVVTEDTITANKKLVAQVRKEANRLDDFRKTVKKIILQPYESFERTVKEILATVQEGEQIVRTQIYEFDEQERVIKEQQLKDIYTMRLTKYPDLQVLNITFERFLKPSHLDKTATVDKTELEMVEWLELHQKDIDVIKTMDNTLEILTEYSRTLSLAQSIQSVTTKHKLAESIQAARATVKEHTDEKDNQTDTQYTFIVFSEKDYITVTKFMKTQNIKFKGE